MSNLPFNADNFEGTAEEIALLNDAYTIAAETWFDGADRENLDLMRQLRLSLLDRIGNVYSPRLTGAEIAARATAK